MVHLRERRVHDLRRHEVGEHLLHPHVVEPPHRHEIAEPHVRRLVRDDAGALEQLVLRRRFVEQQARRRCRGSRRRAPCRRTETTGSARSRTCRTDTGWRCSPRATRAPSRADRRSRRGCARPWPRRSRDGTSATRGRRAARSRPRTCRRRTRTDTSAAAASRRNVSRQRCASDAGRGRSRRRWRPPASPSGTSSVKRVARLQVRLVEAREREVRARRHEQRVEKLVVAVERLVAGHELEWRSRSRRPWSSRRG